MEVVDLTTARQELTTQVAVLTTQVSGLQGTVQNLTTLNSNLESIFLYLNESALDLDETVDELASFLAEQIGANRALVLQNLQTSYQSTLSLWDCTFFDVYRTSSFVNDVNSPIGSANISSVLGHVDEQVLTELCLDELNFELYLESTYNGGDIGALTVTQLTQGVAVYGGLAVDYMFPDMDDEGDGLTQEEWAFARYDCSGLERPYRWSSV